jgi:hypothetical protein
MGASQSDNSIDVLEIKSDYIFINTDTIIITLLQYHFSPDIKDECLKILEETQLDRRMITFYHHKTTIYGLCIPYLLYNRMCISELLSHIDGKYYLM